MGRPGFTLLEVLLALLLLTAGVLGFLEVQRSVTRLAAEGRERGRIALVLESRLEWLRIEARRNGCRPPATGTSRAPDGVLESWNASGTAEGPWIELTVVAWMEGRSRAPDTVLGRMPCP